LGGDWRRRSKDKGTFMCIYLRMPGGRRLFVERATWAGSGRGRWLDVRNENGEVLIWLGGWHAIFTPAGWSPPRPDPFWTGGLCADGRRARR
jgi:hypothetical protein